MFCLHEKAWSKSVVAGDSDKSAQNKKEKGSLVLLKLIASQDPKRTGRPIQCQT